MNFALKALQIASVLSDEKESTTIISSAIPTREDKHLSMFRSSLKVIMTAEMGVIGIYFTRKISPTRIVFGSVFGFNS